MYDFSVHERFWNYVNLNNPRTECWEWIGYKSSRGYGLLNLKIDGRKRPVRAHRLSYEWHVGAIPAGNVVCHKCNNRCCVNPKHLYAGTQKDNIADKVKCGTSTIVPRGITHPKSKITDDVVREIRRLAGKLPQRAIAKQFSIDQSRVSRIVRGIDWKHVA